MQTAPQANTDITVYQRRKMRDFVRSAQQENFHQAQDYPAQIAPRVNINQLRAAHRALTVHLVSSRRFLAKLLVMIAYGKDTLVAEGTVATPPVT